MSKKEIKILKDFILEFNPYYADVSDFTYDELVRIVKDTVEMM